MDDETFDAWVDASRARQGLPPTIEDPVALAEIAALIAPASDPLLATGAGAPSP